MFTFRKTLLFALSLSVALVATTLSAGMSLAAGLIPINHEYSESCLYVDLHVAGYVAQANDDALEVASVDVLFASLDVQTTKSEYHVDDKEFEQLTVGSYKAPLVPIRELPD